MKELKKFEKPEIRYTEFAANDVITTSGGGDDPVKSPMKSAGFNNDNDYIIGLGFEPLQ